MTDLTDLYTLTLDDGLPVEREGKTIRYRRVRLRETTVADERAAQRAAERVVMVGNAPRLLVSEADFRYALTARHIEWFELDGQRIGGELVDVELLGKLSSHDLAMVEQRVFLLNLASEVRYGNMTEQQFAAIASGDAPAPGGQPSPQLQGQAAGVGPAGAATEPGPALLADYVGQPAAGAADGHGG